MISLDIVDTDPFLDMPSSAQNLYFHLNARADDDGFVGKARTVMRTVRSTEDDMRLLIAKDYIIAFESGVIVMTDWHVNNFIRKDRYQPTMYLEEKRLLFITCAGKYTLDPSKGKPLLGSNNNAAIEQQDSDVEESVTTQSWSTVGQPEDSLWSTNGQPVVNQSDSFGQPEDVEIDENFLVNQGKVKLSKVNLSKDNPSNININIYSGGSNKQNVDSLTNNNDSNVNNYIRKKPQQAVAQPPPGTKAYGQNKLVFLSNSDLHELMAEYPNELIQYAIDYMDAEWHAHPRKYANRSPDNHKQQMLKWGIDGGYKVMEGKKRLASKGNGELSQDYDIDQIEKDLLAN